jgi:tetratricopeptide (TPR) repeat protein
MFDSIRPYLMTLMLLGVSSSFAVAADIDECRALLLSGKYEECLTATNEAIEKGVYGESWHLVKADAEFQTGQYEQSLATIQKALERYGWSVRLRWNGIQACRYLNDEEQVDKFVAEIAQLVQSSPWRYTDAENLVTLGDFIIEQGADAKEAQDAFYSRSKRNNPVHRKPVLALGNLALNKRDFQLAAEIFAPALEKHPDDPDIHFGMAAAFTSSDQEIATKHLNKTLELNPNHFKALITQIDQQLDREQYEPAMELIEKILKINPKHPEALAYRTAIQLLQGNETEWTKSRELALSTWSKNPLVDHTIGRELSQKYRFQQGSTYQRQAIEFAPNFLPAKKQLAQDLLRLGKEEDGWKLADEVYAKDPYDVAIYNLVNLRDELEKFTTLEAEGLRIRMSAHEASVYGDHVLNLLAQARSELTEKYKHELPETILVEIFPRPSDFEVRTFGMPGIVGYLGVCFGDVITANSPASQDANPVNLNAVLWHEFAHVVTLNKTNNRMPRWLSEGISVYEERERDPSWGEKMNVTYRQMILDDELSPIGEMSQMFLSPKSGTHVQFAYFQSSLIVEYIIEEYGFDSLLNVLDDLAFGMSINESLERRTAPLKQLDEEFAKAVQKRVDEFGKDVDWSAPDLAAFSNSENATEDAVAWAEENPNNYRGLKGWAKILIEQKDWNVAQVILTQLIELFPAEAGTESPYLMLASVYREIENDDAEEEILRKFIQIEDDSPIALLRLIELSSANENWQQMRTDAMKLLAIKPLIAQPHAALALAGEKTDQPNITVAAIKSLLQLSPTDRADLYFRNAVQLRKLDKLELARRNTLKALEEAPRYREALTLLKAIQSEVPAETTHGF